jgi:hypothetical protein
MEMNKQVTIKLHDIFTGLKIKFTFVYAEYESPHPKVKVMLLPTVSRPVCLGVKHPSRAYGQIIITV